MSAKYKLNKSELTALRRKEKMYLQFLPVLKLKKEQLQIEHTRLRRELAKEEAAFKKTKKAASGLVALLPERLPIRLAEMAKAKELVLSEKGIAGVRVPTLDRIEFVEIVIPRFGLPPWVNRALPRLREFVRINAELWVLRRQFDLVGKELRKATQKVNLFEKVLIPETRDAIRRIRIALGDQEVAAVCRGKIAKGKQIKAAQEARVARAASGVAP